VETQDGGKEMKIEILSELENPLLKRKQFEVKVIHDAATPSLEEIREKVSVSKEIGKGVVIVDSFTSRYGSRETVGTVKVYQTKERAFEIEPKSNLIKNGLIEGEKKEKPKPKEEPKPEEAAKEPEGEKPAEAKEEKPKEAKDEPKEEKKAAEVKEPKPEEKADKKPEEPKEEPKPDKKEDKKLAEETKEVKEEPKPEEKAPEAKEEKPKEEKKGE
jgi:ribosomal protein S24E